jgi:hypothetical protein
MTTMVHIKARLTPWDDREFVRTFERARVEVERSGCCPEGPEAAERVERLLREGGYPDARVEIERTVAEALSRISHWDVRRDG